MEKTEQRGREQAIGKRARQGLVLVDQVKFLL